MYERVAGDDRILTAIEVSKEHHDRSDTVVLARHDIYPDALAGAPLAYQRNAPLLLTTSGALHPDTATEIRRLGADRAILLGETAALSARVEADLAALGVDTTRIGGPDRFDTARRIAQEVSDEHVYIVEGADPDPSRGWPDALSVAPLAAHQQRPILLVTTEVLPEATKRAIDELDATEATIVGGPVAISEEVRAQVEEQGLILKEVAGEDRYDTSAQVATIAKAAGMSEDEPWLATGTNFPDALTAGPTVAAHGGVLLLVPPHVHEGGPTYGWLDTNAIRFTHVRFVGGPVAISEHVVEEVKAAVQDGVTPDPPPPPLDGETLAGPFTFETGSEGWTSDSTDPVVEWRVGPPGHDSGQSFNVPTYNNEMSTTLTSPEFAHPGGRVLLDWWQRVNTEEGWDYLTVGWSSDGEKFQTVEGYSGPNPDYPGFTNQRIEFVAPEGPLYIRFTLSSDALVTSEGAYIDDVIIQH
ncbi:MAG: cell wall-binding repeat-containing protein [Actinobacteria bacterium]|nr:cell wall-binding repeat-containing protein [Actinomycetota bacterium]